MRAQNILIGIALFCIILVISRCNYLNDSDDKTYRHVGDIAFDPEMDDADFKVCYPNRIFQYFNNGGGPEYLEEKIGINEYFFSNYKTTPVPGESGMIRVRFVVNCEGEAGRFRMMASDMDYREKIFDARVTDQLLQLTKNIKQWPTKKYRSGFGDYYMYLIFKIRDSQLIEVMP